MFSISKLARVCRPERHVKKTCRNIRILATCHMASCSNRCSARLASQLELTRPLPATDRPQAPSDRGSAVRFVSQAWRAARGRCPRSAYRACPQAGRASGDRRQVTRPRWPLHCRNQAPALRGHPPAGAQGSFQPLEACLYVFFQIANDQLGPWLDSSVGQPTGGAPAQARPSFCRA